MPAFGLDRQQLVALEPGAARLRIRSADACTFNADGLITSLRAFWGPDDIEPA